MDAARKAVDLSLKKALDLVEAHAGELGALDAAAGDGDHGTTMVRGLRAANAAVEELDGDTPAGQALASAGSAFADAAGGASGALFGMLLITIGQQLGEGPYDAASVGVALQAATTTVSRMGKAKVGDKTFVDTLAPFVAALQQAALDEQILVAAWHDALGPAERGMESTAGMVARKGRASRLGERSREGLDPGAVSIYYLLQAAGEAISEACAAEPPA